MGIFKSILNLFTGDSKKAATTPTSTAFEDRKAHYRKLFDSLVILPTKVSQAREAYNKMLRLKPSNLEVQRRTGVPWFMVGFLHNMEGDSNPLAGLHNGQPWSKKTTDEPKGRGPFTSYIESAVDALKLKGFDKITDWSVERMCWAAEKYNGFGYVNRGDRSPYIVGGSNHQIKGKWAKDHVWDPDLVTDQIGFMTLLHYYYQVSGELLPGKEISDVFVPKVYDIHNDRDLNPKLEKYLNDKILANPMNHQAFKSRDPHRLMVLAAEAMEGIREEGGNNKGPLVSLIQDTVGSPEALPWCMSTVQTAIAYAERYSGYRSPIVSSEGVQFTFLKSPGTTFLDKPIVGCIQGWIKHGGWEGHCGIVKGTLPNGNTVGTEGNTSEEGFNRDGDVVRQRERKRGGYTVGVTRFDELGFLNPWPEVK